MRRSRALRTLLAVLLVLAQSAAGSFAAQMAGPCALQMAHSPSDQDHATRHHGPGTGNVAGDHLHHAGQEDGEADTDAAPHFSPACCSACAVGLTVVALPLSTPHWLRRAPVSVATGLEPGELTSTDPPPRLLL